MTGHATTTSVAKKRRVYLTHIEDDLGCQTAVFGTWQRAVDALARWGYEKDTTSLNRWTRGEDVALMQIQEVA